MSMAAFRSFVAVCLICVSGCGQASAPTSPASTSTDRAAALQAAVTSWAAVAGHHGVSASVVFADGTVWSASAGRSGPDDLTLTHLIGIGSITKTMTAAVVLQLAGEGRLGLDDPISRFLPPRPHVDTSITVRQLLNHTNGLANYTGTSALSQAIMSLPAHVFSADELLSLIGPPRFLPGADTEYTNTAYLLAGQVAEHVTGTDIVSLYRTRIWGPQGLSAVWMPGHGGAPGVIAWSQSEAGVVMPTSRMAQLSVGHSAFGLMATAGDIARWGHALFTGTAIPASMQAEMRRMVPAAGNIPGESGAGLGVRGYSYLGRSQIGHSGASAFSNSLLLHDTTARVTVVVLMNQSSGADHFTLAPALLELALRP